MPRRRQQRARGRRSQPLDEPLQTSPAVLDITPTRFAGEVIDIIIDFLHDDKHELGTCALVCKSWLPASRYHLFRSITIRSHNIGQFVQLMRCRYTTFPSYTVHLDIGVKNRSFFTPRSSHISLILRVLPLCYLGMTHVNLYQNSLGRSLNDFKAITALEFTFVRLSTCGSLLDILAATPLLESVRLSEVYWKGVGDIPASQSFQHLSILSTHCEGNSQILGWLSKGSLPVLSRLSIRARSSPRGEFLRALGSSLEHLVVKISVNQHHDKQNEISFLNSADLSRNTNLRSITIDSLSLPHAPYEVDVRFPSLVSMLSRIASPSLDTISLNLAQLAVYGDVNNVPWDQLAQIFTMHSNSLQSINIMLPGVALGDHFVLGLNDWVLPTIERQMKDMERLIIARLKGVQLDTKLLAITNICFPHP